VVEPIDDFERELREQLTAREAPEGFADRVMARVAERDKARERRRWFRQPVWRWAAATALAAIVAVGVGVQHEREQRREGEAARAQVMLALRITGTTLRDVERKIDNPVGRQSGNRRADQKED
jgi:anti-sigma-K factor RskA